MRLINTVVVIVNSLISDFGTPGLSLAGVYPRGKNGLVEENRKSGVWRSKRAGCIKESECQNRCRSGCAEGTADAKRVEDSQCYA